MTPLEMIFYFLFPIPLPVPADGKVFIFGLSLSRAIAEVFPFFSTCLLIVAALFFAYQIDKAH